MTQPSSNSSLLNNGSSYSFFQNNEEFTTGAYSSPEGLYQNITVFLKDQDLRNAGEALQGLKKSETVFRARTKYEQAASFFTLKDLSQATLVSKAYHLRYRLPQDSKEMRCFLAGRESLSPKEIFACRKRLEEWDENACDPITDILPYCMRITSIGGIQKDDLIEMVKAIHFFPTIYQNGPASFLASLIFQLVNIGKNNLPSDVLQVFLREFYLSIHSLLNEQNAAALNLAIKTHILDFLHQKGPSHPNCREIQKNLSGLLKCLSPEYVHLWHLPTRSCGFLIEKNYKAHQNDIHFYLLAAIELHKSFFEIGFAIIPLLSNAKLDTLKISYTNFESHLQKHPNIPSFFYKSIIDFYRTFSSQLRNARASFQDELHRILRSQIVNYPDQAFTKDMHKMGKSGASHHLITNHTDYLNEIYSQKEEFQTWVVEQCEHIQEMFQFLSILDIFMFVEDFQALETVWKTERMDPKSPPFTSFLKSAVLDFEKKYKEQKSIQIKAAKMVFIKPDFIEMRKLYQNESERHRKIANFIQGFYCAPFEIYRKADISLEEYIKVTYPQEPKKADEKKCSKEIEKPEPSKEIVKNEEEKHPSSSTSPSKRAPTPDLVSSLLSLFLPTLEKLSNNFPLPCKEALQNASRHVQLFITLLPTLSKESTPDTHFAIITALLSEAGMLFEQLLSAVDFHYNPLKSTEDKDQRLTHDLRTLLERSEKHVTFLTSTDTLLILGFNKCEIFSRDLASKSQESVGRNPYTNAKKILMQAYQGLRDEDTAKLNQAVINTKKLCAVVLNQVVKLIHFSGLFTNQTFSQNSKQLQNLLANLSSPSSIPRPLPAVKIVEKLNELISLMQDHPNYSTALFANLRTNLLKRLHVHLATISTGELALSYPSILLLHHYIAEEFMLTLLTLQEKDVDLRKVRHNLVQLVQELGFDFASFTDKEKAFLKAGKIRRTFLRYPATIASSDEAKKNTT